MLIKDAYWLVEEPGLDEPADLLTAFPEINQHIAHEPHDDELGLRALLETLEAPPSPWWSEGQPRHRGVARRGRRSRARLAAAA